jgi:hypothetical protein
MLMKCDVLVYLGKASGPLGTYKESPVPRPSTLKLEKKEEYKVRGQFLDSNEASLLTSPVQSLDGPALRQLIVSTMLQSSLAARTTMPGSFFIMATAPF